MAILDQYGNPVRTADLRRELAGPTLSGVRSILTEHPAQGLTPGRLAVLLREAETGHAIQYLELAEEMEEKNLHYLAVLGTRKRQVAQLDVRVVPVDDSEEAVGDADLVREWIEDEPLEDELVDVMDAVGKGYSVTEIMWDFSERQWMPKRLEFRDPRWFEFDQIDGRTLHMRGLENRLEPLAPFKFVVHRFAAKSGLPIRGGFARMVAWLYLFANYGLKDWVQFIETYGQPMRIGKFPSNASADDKAILLRALSNLGSDAAAMIPESMLIELIQGGQGGRGAETAHAALLAYIDALISKAVLGQTLTTEAGDRGARSLGEVHDKVRGDIEQSDAFALGQTLTRDISRPIVALNRGERRRYPQIVIGREDTLDVTRTADALTKLVPLGLRVSEKDVREMVGFEAPEDGDVILGAPRRDPGTDPGRPGTGEPGDGVEGARALARSLRALARGGGAPARRVEDDIDAAVEGALDDGGWRQITRPSIEPLLAAVRRAGDFDELLAAIEDGSLFQEIDTEALATLLSQLAFSAEASGEG